MGKFSLLDSAEECIKAIPRNPYENVLWRPKFHKLFVNDKKAQNVFWELCKQDLQVLFDTTFTTLDPRKPWGEQNQPFILRIPKQIEAVHLINNNIKNGKDVGINKTRDEGASEICAKIFAAWCMLYERVSFILGSDKKEDVDNQGNDFTLFAKVDNVFQNLPSWMDFKYETDGGCIKRKDMLLRVKRNNSAIIGETTNENFSAGSRATAMVLDEFGRIRKSIADSIEGTVHAVTNCVIYSSTHWLGQNHTFNLCINKKTTDMVELLWHQNPEKAAGLYKSPQAGIIELVDVDYYKEQMPVLMNCLNGETKFELEAMPEKFHDKFVADGNKDRVVWCRSPWHDFKEEESHGNKRDFYCNTWATPLGSSDAVFDHVILNEIKEGFVRPPDVEGEIHFDYSDDESIINCVLIPNYGQRRLKWWGYLIQGRPDQRHNFIVGVDPSQGLGSSNAAIYIYDVNTHEFVGEWVCPNTKPEMLADMAVAIATWCGGVLPAFLIWERNGGHGTTFTERVAYLGYYWCYHQMVEDTKTRKKKDKYGFHSNQDRKAALLNEFGVALGYGVQNNLKYVAAKIYSEELVSELFDYMFVKDSKEITTSEKADLSTGARERHGDRAIAAALCILGCRDQDAGDYKETREVPVGSFQYHKLNFEKQQREEEKVKKKYLF